MRKSIFGILAILAVFTSGWMVSSNAQPANSCLACHGNADKLKILIKDEDFNKAAGEEGFG